MTLQPVTARDGIYGCRARIGYASPPLMTEVFAYEFYQIVPAGVTLVLTTLGIVERDQAEVDRAYEASMRAAHEMAAAGVDIVVLGGVPINLSRGPDNAQAVIRALEAELKVKVSTSLSAQENAARTLGCRKVVIAQPYDASQNARQSGYAEGFGCEVLGAAGWGSIIPRFGQIPRDAALSMGRALIRQYPQADSILFSSPHWPTMEAIEPLERELGINVMTALQATAWDALRRVGVIDRIEGYGRLFREF
jgi:maleate isomerase